MIFLSHQIPTREIHTARLAVKWLGYLLLLGLILALFWLLYQEITPTLPLPAPEAPASLAPAKTHTATSAVAHNGATAPTAPATSPRRTATEQTTVTTRPPNNEDLQAAGLVNWLQQLIPPGEKMTVVEAQMLNEDTRLLASLGSAAIPAIRRFLSSQADVLYTESAGGEFASYPTLRIALMEALGMINGVEAENLLYDMLTTTSNPAEIGVLADILEERSPGYYHATILQATQRSLNSITRNPVSQDNLLPEERIDAAPLFAILQKYGDETTVAELEKALDQWESYALISLAELPDGQGIATLSQVALNPARRNSEQGRLSLQLLAQTAVTNREAREALLDLVHTAAIPESSWPLLAEVIAGDHQLQLTKPNPAAELMGSSLKENPYSTQTIVGRGVQTVYSVHYSAVLSPDEFNQRADLLDTLAAETDNPAAQQAISNAQALLAGAGH